MTAHERKAAADRILYGTGLYNRLAEIGKPHVVGSCLMNMMAWNDLDIDIENGAMNLEKLYALTGYILQTFSPVWYEAKEVVDDEGRTVWFHGFEAVVEGELWNFDLWFFDEETIVKAEAYCGSVAERCEALAGSREAILSIKQELISRELYSFEKYTSMDVYRAVLEQEIYTAEEFLEQYVKPERNTI